jgi:CRP/FNR family transcriptional regulator, cyclic AMP receptor protein
VLESNHKGTPYGLPFIENCVTCPQRHGRLFCNLATGAIQHLAKITRPAIFPKGATLFVERQPARGVFILCTGHVKLSTSSPDGRTLILGISQPGDLMGLPATLTGRPYEVSAQVVELAQINFVSRADFLGFLHEHGQAALRAAQALSGAYQSAFAEMRNIGLSRSAGERLARFLLNWIEDHGSEEGAMKINLALTHEEIAQMIGTSRETVTRLFAHFRREDLLQIKGSTLTIKNKQGIAKLAGSN